MVMRPQVKEIRGKAANQHSRAHLCDWIPNMEIN
jgi:hypothetical protein